MQAPLHIGLDHLDVQAFFRVLLWVCMLASPALRGLPGRGRLIIFRKRLFRRGRLKPWAALHDYIRLRVIVQADEPPEREEPAGRRAEGSAVAEAVAPH